MGLVFFVVYFLLFSAVIRMFNLKTPGREDTKDDVVTSEANSNTEEGLTQLATSYIAAVGGTDNLKAIDACITRLRLTVGDSARVSDAMCKRLGASGVVKLNKQTIQVIVGAKAESIGDEMKKWLPVDRLLLPQRIARLWLMLRLLNRRLYQTPLLSPRWFHRLRVRWSRLSRYLTKRLPAKRSVTVLR